MKYLLGSKFWKMNIDSSDNDYLQFVFPTKEDLFKGKFKSECCKINNDDINIKDIRLLLKELKKGSVKIFECLYNNECELSSDVRFTELHNFLTDNRDTLFNEVNYQFKKACYGEFCNRLKIFKSDFSNTKALAHCYKLHFLLTHEEPFKQWFEYESYNEAIRLRYLQDKNDKQQLLNYLEEEKNKLALMKFTTNKDTPTVDKLEQLLMKLCLNV